MNTQTKTLISMAIMATAIVIGAKKLSSVINYMSAPKIDLALEVEEGMHEIEYYVNCGRYRYGNNIQTALESAINHTPAPKQDDQYHFNLEAAMLRYDGIISNANTRIRRYIKGEETQNKIMRMIKAIGTEAITDIKKYPPLSWAEEQFRIWAPVDDAIELVLRFDKLSMK